MSGIKWGRVGIQQLEPIDNVIIVASGPSVNAIAIDKLKKLKNTYIITVNGAGTHVPFADAWFTLDPWGLAGPQLPVDFKGKLFAAVPDDFGTPIARVPQHRAVPTKPITYLHRLHSHNYTNISSETAYVTGLSEDSSCISTGNSGYGALNFAYHLRPKNIYLLGIDGTIGYFYKSNKNNRPLTYLQIMFQSAVQQLEKQNIKVLNVSPNSVVTAFPKITADEFHKILDGI